MSSVVKQSSSTPLPVIRILRKLGQDIRDARLRRRIPVAVMAARAGLSRITLSKIENGEPTSSLGAYATVLFVLGLEGRLADIADIKNDELGLRLEEDRLPKRIRNSTKHKA
ncbi:MAG: helix-turn-helix domain-containing protein [Alphaproteobacteria bacterium]|nr:helix-turn-helix domain-containing protein [Alphaproteobacteria bacterium]